MKFTVVGSFNSDLVTTVKTVPRGGETVHATGFETHNGGKGANQAYALRRLTEANVSKVAMVGCVGNDAFGKAAFEHLQKSNIDVSQLKLLDGIPTGVATILVEESGENRIMVFAGANDKVEPPKNYNDSDFVVLQNEIPLSTTFEVIKQCRSLGIKTVFNPSPLPSTPINEWPKVDILVVNEGEAASLAGIDNQSIENDDPRKLAEKALPALTNSADLVIVTLGGSGVIWTESPSSSIEFLPAWKVDKIVDTTGAGDTFLAAFLSQYENAQLTTADRIKFATKASAIAVTRKGAASSIPTLEEVSRM